MVDKIKRAYLLYWYFQQNLCLNIKKHAVHTIHRLAWSPYARGPLGKCPAWPCVKTVLDIWRTTRKVGERLRSADTSKRRRNCSHPTIPTTIHHTTTLACLRGQLFFCFFCVATFVYVPGYSIHSTCEPGDP